MGTHSKEPCTIRVGISGWTYAGWRGVFYPEDLPQRRELEYASRQFRSIEINGTHYSLQIPGTFRKWRDATPEDFVFSIKGSRYITHFRKLRDIREPLANFFASGVLELGQKMGPFLWQFPPDFRWDPGLMGDFLGLLPRTYGEAAVLAGSHGAAVEGRTSFGHPEFCDQPLRHAVEIRHPGFLVPEFFDLLESTHTAFVFADTAGKWPYVEEFPTDFLYLRLHGAEELYVSGYGDDTLKFWADRILSWTRGQQLSDSPRIRKKREIGKISGVYVYFDNDAKVKAPGDALTLNRFLHEG